MSFKSPMLWLEHLVDQLTFSVSQLIYFGYLPITVKIWLESGKKVPKAIVKNFLFYTELSFLLSPGQNQLICLKCFWTSTEC